MKTQWSRLSLVILSILFCAPSIWSQKRVDTRNTYERLLCVVPMVGAGTYEDPRRPAYAPATPLPDQAPSREGILAFAYQLSDDEQFALVEFVAVSRSAFRDILTDTNVKAFVKGKVKRSVIESEFKKYKTNLDLDKLEVRVP